MSGLRLSALGVACGLPLSLVALRLLGRAMWVRVSDLTGVGAMVLLGVCAVSLATSFRAGRPNPV